MKKLITLLLVFCLCSAFLAACGGGNTVENSNDNSDSNSEDYSSDNSQDNTATDEYVLDAELDFKGEDYILKFKKINDYSSALTAIYINPECKEDICINIPETDEDGTPVARVQLNPLTAHLFLPMYTKGQFDTILQEISDNDGDMEADMFASFYTKKDINDKYLTESIIRHILADYPICEYAVIYTAEGMGYYDENSITVGEAKKLENLLKDYADIDEEYLINSAQEIIDLIPNNAECKQEYYELFKEYALGMKYQNYDCVTEIVFPENMSELVDISVFDDYKNLSKVTGFNEHCSFDGGWKDLKDFTKDILSDDYYGYISEESDEDIFEKAFLNTFENGDLFFKPEDIKFEPEVSEPEISEPEVSEPEVSEPEVSEPEDTTQHDICLGEFNSDSYENDYFGLGWTLPQGWTFASAAELDLTNNALQNNAAFWTRVDVSAGDSYSDCLMQITLTKMDPSALKDYSEEQWHSEETMEEIKQGYLNSYGFMCESIELTPSFIKIGEKNYYALDIRLDMGTFGNIVMSQIVIIEGEYSATISVGSSSKYRNESVWTQFYTIDE